MNIAFVSGTPHIPQVVGGVEVNTHQLAAELIRRGNSVCVLAKLSLRDAFGAWRAGRLAASRRKLWVDHALGYPVFRARHPCGRLAALPRPAVAVVQNGPMVELAAGFAAMGVPAVAYLHGLGFEAWPGDAARLPFAGYIANSRFTAERFRRRFGAEPLVVPPLFRRDDYATAAAGRMVTFINPVPVKGVDLALRIAALCPQVPFGFVRGWPLGPREAATLKRRIRRLGNVQLLDRRADMRGIYRETRILLVPSQWEDETWGRVVSEAQFSGIPVVASDRGGLPEAVGPGGLVLAHDAPAEVWAEAVAALWSDRALHDRLSAAALAYSARPELDPERQVRRLVEALEGFIRTGAPDLNPRATAA